MSTTPVSPAQGTDGLVLVQQLLQQIQANSITGSQLWPALSIAGLVNSYRCVYRFLAVDVASGQWGTPNWNIGYSGYEDVTSEEGTTNLQKLSYFMARHQGPTFEVQFFFNNAWYSAASLLYGNPMVPNTVPGIPQLYMPGPQVSVFSFGVPAEQNQAPVYPQPTTSNAINPVGTVIPGFTYNGNPGFHNIGGSAWSINGMKDPSGQYTLINPSPMYNSWSLMVWVK